MVATRPRSGISPETSIAAIHCIAERGYEATTAEDLADAVGMSRSTFFRRFGSKDDVIFADHDIALARLETHLRAPNDMPAAHVIRGTLDVLHLLTRDVDAARARFEVLRQTPALRERELVITHRYERVIAEFLDSAATDATPRWVPIALAAGIVSVHNAALRHWLRDPDPRIITTLDRELHELFAQFTPWFSSAGETREAAPASRVLVAVYDATEAPERVLAQLGAQLGSASSAASSD